MSWKVQFHENAQDFLDVTLNSLAEDETKNNLVLGIALRLREDLHAFGEQMPLMVTVMDVAGTLGACAVMTPPFPIVVQSEPLSEVALEVLADSLLDLGWRPSGVNGVEEVSDAFAKIWTRKTQWLAKPIMNMRAYELREVKELPVPSGAFRLGLPEDAQQAAELMNAMASEVILGPQRKHTAESMMGLIERRNLFFWEDDGKLVSMTVANRPQIKGICVSGVYTPPQHRGKGYARALVAAVSKEMLARGYELTNLFTDLSNPTSNKIYQEIGYYQVCDYHQYEFVNKEISQ